MIAGRRPLAAALALVLCLGLAAFGNEDLQYALSLMGERQEYSQAAQKLQECLRGNLQGAEQAQALYYLGNCYTRLGKDRQAAQVYEKLSAVGYKDEKLLQDALCLGGDAWFRTGEYAKAVKLYGKLLETYPQIAQAQACAYWKAECLARMYRADGKKEKETYKAARKAYAEFLTKWTKSENCEEAMLANALLAYEAGEYKAARSELQQFMKQYPKSRQLDAALCYAAESAYWLGDYAPAAQAFAQLRKAYPQSTYRTQALAAGGWCAYALGKKESAGDLFAQAADKTDEITKKAGLQLQAARAYEEAGNSNFALKYYRLVRDSKAAESAVAGYRIALVLQQQALSQKLPEKQAELLMQVVAGLNQSLPQMKQAQIKEERLAMLLLGETQMKLKSFAAAADVFGRIAARWSDADSAPYALYQQAVSLASADKVSDAADVIRELLRKYPQSTLRLRAAYAMADYQQRLGQPKKGEMAYRWLVTSGCKWAQDYKSEDASVNTQLLQTAHQLRQKALIRLGEMMMAQNKLQSAGEYLSKLVTDYPDSSQVPAALLRLAEITQKNGQLAQAQKQYAQAEEKARQMLAEKNTEQKDVLRRIEVESAYRARVCRLLAAQQAEGARKEDLLREAGRFCQEYLDKFSKVSAAKVQCERVRYYLAESFYGVGDMASAAREYGACYDAQPAGPLADTCLFGMGWSLWEQDTVAAVKKLQLLLEKFPQSDYRPEASLLLATCLQKQGKHTLAVEILDRHVLQDAVSSDIKARAMLQKSVALEAAGDAQNAVAIQKKLVAEFPGKKQAAQALYNLSWGLQKKLEKAEKPEAKQKLAKEVCKVLAQLLREHEDFAAADECALRLGEFAYADGDYNAALAQYKKAASLSKGNLQDRIYYRMGCVYGKLAYKQSGKEKMALQGQALEALRKSLAVSAQGEVAAECAWRAGEILFSNDKFKQAAKYYAQTINQTKDSSLLDSARYGLGLCLIKQEQPGKALEVLKQIIARKEKQSLWYEANCAAGQACLMLGALADSQGYFTAARGDGYGAEVAARARLGLGEVALRKKELRRAREEFRKVDVFHKQWKEDAALGLLKAAEVSKSMGEFPAAVKDLELLLKKYPQSGVAGQARRMLADNQAARKEQL